MLTTTERRTDGRGRLSFDIPVELSHGDDTYFEADAVDLSPGGLSLRSACLPEIGEQLTCRFETVPGGARVQGHGEVVWARLSGERSGEFGLRFVELAAEAQALIDEMVAERASHGQGGRDHGEPQSAKLELDGVEAPISARIIRAGTGEAVFEQRLPLLDLGRGVLARAGHVRGRGEIAEVTLRMDGETPTLAVRVRFEHERSLFGEFDWDARDAAGPEVDTMPDLEAPDGGDEPAAQEPITRATVTEFQAVVDVNAAAPEPDDEPLPPALEAAPEDEVEAWTHPLPDPARGSALVRLLRIFVAIRSVLHLTLQRGARVAWPIARKHGAAALGATCALVARRLLPRARAGLHKLTARPRRTTTAPAAHRHDERSYSIVRLAALSVIAITAIALGVYALAPSADQDAIPLHRRVQVDVPAAETVTQAPPAAAPEPTAPTTPVTMNPAYAAAMLGQTPPPPSTVPTTSPYAVDVRDATKKPLGTAGARPGGASFGDLSVPSAQRFVLRMNAPIKSLQGHADASGFTVVALGAISLDRAAPIRESHAAIERAMILNKGDRAELTLRFVTGKKPAYRVTARGTELEVLLAR